MERKPKRSEENFGKKSAPKSGASAKISSIEEKLAERNKTQERFGREKKRMDPARAKRIMLIVFAVLMVFTVVRGILQIRDLREQEKEVQIELEEKIAEKEKLEQQKEYINSEEYIEQAARDMLKMIKPGEILYILKDNETEDEGGEE